MKKCQHCIYLGLTTQGGVPYALYSCNGERLWASRLSSDFAECSAPLSAVKKLLYGKSSNLFDKLLRAAFYLFQSR